MRRDWEIPPTEEFQHKYNLNYIYIYMIAYIF